MVVGDFVAVGMGAVTGAICRYQVGNVVSRKIANDPNRLSYLTGWHTAGINICGSFVLGAIAGIPDVASASTKDHPNDFPRTATSTGEAHTNFLSRGISPRMRLLAGVGFCGSFTTFSTFSVDVVGMLSRGDMTRAFSYMAVNNVGGILAAFAGFHAVKKMMTRL